MKHIFTNTSIMRLQGFTLVETLVSVMIITLSILGPLTVATSASTHARDTKDTLIASYLAQEAIELLRHQQDSVYIRCIQSLSSVCALMSGETPPEAAWRIFKARLGSNPQGASCFASTNPSGCSYDFIDMTENQDIAPRKYVSTQSSCNSLSIESATNLFVCGGVHGTGAGFVKSNYSRSVSIVSIPTISGPEQSYHDDLRVTVSVTFKRANGYTKTFKVIDFLHAKS